MYSRNAELCHTLPHNQEFPLNLLYHGSCQFGLLQYLLTLTIWSLVYYSGDILVQIFEQK